MILVGKKYDLLIHVITFVNILLIGSDIFSFEFIGVTIRYVQMSLLLGSLLVFMKRKKDIIGICLIKMDT